MVKVSSVGYYHEWLIMDSLTQLIPTATFPQANIIQTKVTEASIYYKETVPANQPKDKDKFLAACLRAERSAPILAAKMVSELPNTFDEIIIAHVGGAGLGKAGSVVGGKADIQVTGRKDNDYTIIINASIKIAVGGWITLLTTGSAGLMQKLFFPDVQLDRGAKAYNGVYDQLNTIPSLAHCVETMKDLEAQRAFLSDLKDQAKQNKNKEEVNNLTREMIPVINGINDMIYGDIFNYYYNLDKQTINENFLKAMGLDQSDDVFYTLVKEATSKSPETHYHMSSATSKSYSDLYGALKKDFTISFDATSGRGDKSATRKIILTNDKGEVFWTSAIQFQQSGGGSHKLFMQDFQEIVDNNNENYVIY